MKFKQEFEGEEYITFEVAKLQNPDKFGREYTVNCTTKEEVIEEKTPSNKKVRKTKKGEYITFRSKEIILAEAGMILFKILLTSPNQNNHNMKKIFSKIFTTWGKFKKLFNPMMISITALIISIFGIYFQFFNVKHEINYAILDSELNKENQLLTSIFFKNSGNQTEIVLNAYLQLEFYSKEKITEKRISELNSSDFPIILSPGDFKRVILNGNLKDYLFGMYEISLEDPSYFFYMPVTVFENLKLSLVITYLSKRGKFGEELRHIGYVNFDKENEEIQSIVYDPIRLKKLNLNNDKDVLFHTFMPIEREGNVSIDLNDSASLRKNYDKIQLLNRINKELEDN